MELPLDFLEVARRLGDAVRADVEEEEVREFESLGGGLLVVFVDRRERVDPAGEPGADGARAEALAVLRRGSSDGYALQPWVAHGQHWYAVFVQVVEEPRGHRALDVDVLPVAHRGIEHPDQEAVGALGVGEVRIPLRDGIEAFVLAALERHLRAERELP